MLEISVSHAIPQVERQERQPEAFVLRDVAQLVTPDRGRRFEARDDHVAERDRAEATSGQNEIRETAIAHVEEAAVAPTRPRDREQTHQMTDWIGMMRDKTPTERNGLGDGRDDLVDRREHSLARREGRVEVQRQELLFAIHVDRGHTRDALAAGDDVLGAALADELEDVDCDLIIRRTREDLHWREIPRRGQRGRSAGTKHQPQRKK